MGELVRLALVRFTKDNLLFGGKGSDLLFKRGNFFTKYVSEIERCVSSSGAPTFFLCQVKTIAVLTGLHFVTVISAEAS